MTVGSGARALQEKPEQPTPHTGREAEVNPQCLVVAQKRLQHDTWRSRRAPWIGVPEANQASVSVTCLVRCDRLPVHDLDVHSLLMEVVRRQNAGEAGAHYHDLHIYASRYCDC